MGAGTSAAADDASRAASEPSTNGIFIGPYYIYYDYDGTYNYRRYRDYARYR